MPSQSQRAQASHRKRGHNNNAKGRVPGTKNQRQNKGRESRRSRQQGPEADSISNSRRQPSEFNDPADDPAGDLSDEVLALRARLASINALHVQWRAEDRQADEDWEADVWSDPEMLLASQRQRCRDVGSLVFGFTLQEAQIDAIHTIFYQRRDLLLLAKTGFGKSLIFQLLPFMLDPTGVVIILMPLKLLQAEQNAMINRIPTGKAIALTGENNQQRTQLAIARESYTHVFTSPEIALSKKFKKNVLDDPRFASRLSLLAIDEIHLVEEWGKNFRPLYAEIDKIRKRIPSHVPLLGVSATLTKSMRHRILAKAGFRDDYMLMQTSLDRPEIQQVHRVMQHSKTSCLDLQFVLPPNPVQAAKDIQKTIIFVNSVADIRPMIDIIIGWMKKLGYPAQADKWIRPYYSTMSDWDKGLIAQAFRISGDENTECTILVATDAYGMGIDNPDIRLVVQWDLPMSFDSMIQRMGRAGRKGCQAAFVLFTPGWTQVDGPEEIENRMKKRTDAANANSQLSDTNRPKQLRRSPLNQEIVADELSDNESVADSEPDEFTDPATDQLFNLLTTDVENETHSRTSKKRESKTNAAKRENLPDEIFDYIHTAKCRRLFSLAWYDDQTYVSTSKTLPDPCCNGPSCKSGDPEYLKRAPFVVTTAIKLNESDREWLAYRTAELKEWRATTSKAYWLEQKVSRHMPDSLLMSDACLAALAKNGEYLDDELKIREFIGLWPALYQFTSDILACLHRSTSHGGDCAPTKSMRKAALTQARASKKAKFMDNPAVAAAAKKQALKDQWLLVHNKMTPDLKIRLKKAQDAEKKQHAKKDKNREKTREQAQVNDIRRLAFSNSFSPLGAFKDILSDPVDPPPTASEFEGPVHHTPASQERVDRLRALGASKASKKKASRLNRLQQNATTRSPSPPPVRMEQIRPAGKRTVKVSEKAVESTPSKRMRAATTTAVESSPSKRIRPE